MSDTTAPVDAADRYSQADWVYKSSNFTRMMGLEVDAFERGLCRTRLPVTEAILNQGGVVHGGVYGVIADHTVGMAASTTIGEGLRVVTIDYSVNILRPGDCAVLLTEGTVVKEGKRIIYGEATVEGAMEDGSRELLCRAMLTFAVIPKRPPAAP